MQRTHPATATVENSAFSAPKARNVIAQVNALGKGHNNPRALKARNGKCRLKTLRISLVPLSFRAFSAGNPKRTPPGPLAQAVTFRAFGAENPEFSHSLYPRGGTDLMGPYRS